MRFALLLVALTTTAQAAQYSFNLHSNSLNAPYWGGRVAVSEVTYGKQLLSVGLSERALDVGVRRNVALLALGTASLNLIGAYAYGRGIQLGVDASGSVGPVALAANISGWTAAPADIDPLARWGLGKPADLSAQGHLLSAQARYRLRRNLIITLSAHQGPQTLGAAQAEWRRDNVSYRAGAQLGQHASGALLGVSYRTDNFSLSADTLLGPKAGVTLQLDAPAALTIGQNAADIGVYWAYESWRATTAPLRYGLSLNLPVGSQVWSVRLLGGSGGAGAELGWQWTPEGLNPSSAIVPPSH